MIFGKCGGKSLQWVGFREGQSGYSNHNYFFGLISSAVPKAYSITRHPSSLSVVNIFKWHLHWSQEAHSYHISHIAFIGSGNESHCFLSQSEKNSGCYGNLQLPLTYNWKKKDEQSSIKMLFLLLLLKYTERQKKCSTCIFQYNIWMAKLILFK